MDFDSSTKFISSLAKFLQSLCNGYVEFDNGVEVIGHIYLNVDTGKKIDYILNEKVCKTDENSVTFISNSFHAQPAEKPKPAPKVSKPPEPEKSSDLVDSHEDDIVILEDSGGKSDPSSLPPKSHRPISASKRSHHQSFPQKTRSTPSKQSRLNPNGAHETDALHSDPNSSSSNFLGSQSIPPDPSSGTEADVSHIPQVFPQTGDSSNSSGRGVVHNIKQEPPGGANDYGANVKQEYDSTAKHEYDSTAQGEDDQMYDDQDQSGYGGMYDEEYYGGATGDPAQAKQYGQDYYPGAPGPSGSAGGAGGGDSAEVGRRAVVSEQLQENCCPVQGCQAMFFRNVADFCKHWSEKHTEIIRIFHCKMCPSSSKRKTQVLRHIRQRHGVNMDPNTQFNETYELNKNFMNPAPLTLESVLGIEYDHQPYDN